MTEYYHDSKLKRTKVCACASILIVIILVLGVLGSIVLWKLRFPNSHDDYYLNHHAYKPNLHKYPPHDNWGGGGAGYNNRPGVSIDATSTPKSRQQDDDDVVVEVKTDVPGILKATSELPLQNGGGIRDGTISIDDDDEVPTHRPTTTIETLTMSKGRTVTTQTTAKPPKTNKPTESVISDSFGSFEKSFNYYWRSVDSSSSSLDDYEYIVPGSASDEDGKPIKLIPWTPDYESESMSTPNEMKPSEGSGFGIHFNRFGSGDDDEEGSGFGDMETSGDDAEGSGGGGEDYDSIDYLPMPDDGIFDTQQFDMLDNEEYSSSVTEISNVLKDPKQEYEFWKYIYDQSEVLVGYIEDARQKLIRQELSPDVVDPHLPSVQLVRTPGPEDNFRGRCYNVSIIV